MHHSEWKLPLNLAVGIHLVVFLSAMYVPGMLKSKPKFADIYTVSIINIAEPLSPAQESPEAQTPQTEAAPAPKPATKKIAPIIESKPQKPAPVKSISLNPAKHKKIKKVVEQDNSREERERLAQALKEEAIAREKARLAKEALEEEKRLLAMNKTAPSGQSKPQGNSASQARPTRGSDSLVAGRYLASIVGKLQSLWALPDHMQKDNNLEAVVVITVTKDGRIADMFFEKGSGNRVYDQFVRKTLRMADPLPAIPPAMKKQRLELGLVFKPGEIR